MPNKYTNKLTGARVLVLGGTSGIGFCVAENALENGAIVTIASSRQSSVGDALDRLRKSYPDLASNVSGQTVDLRFDDAESNILSLLKLATNDGKDPLDHIVNTAGDSLAVQGVDKFTGPDMIVDAMRVRVATTIYIAKLAPGKYLKKSSRSSITMTGGVNTYQPAQDWSLIAAVGGAGDGLTRGLAVDLRPIRVNAVAPGAIDTELFDKAFGGNKEALEGVKAKFAAETLMGKMGTPEDMSEAYLYAMRDGFLTGQTILSEGGKLLVPGTK